MRPRSLKWLVLVCVVIGGALWIGSFQKMRLDNRRLEALQSSGKIDSLLKLQAEMQQDPAAPLPTSAEWQTLQDARRELFRLRGQVNDLRQAARFNPTELDQYEQDTSNELEDIDLKQAQREALQTLSSESRNLGQVSNRLSSAFAYLLRRQSNAQFPSSLEDLRAQLVLNLAKPSHMKLLSIQLQEAEEKMQEYGIHYNEFEAVRESRFFNDGIPRWFLRTTAAKELPDGRTARPYWPVWSKSYNWRAQRDLRLHPEVYQSSTSGEHLVYD